MSLKPVLLLVAMATVTAKPTIYMKTTEDKLSPVLVPLSSTVIPLPIYKVGLTVSSGDVSGYDKTKLITAKTQKTHKSKGATVKLISREDFKKTL